MSSDRYRDTIGRALVRNGLYPPFDRLKFEMRRQKSPPVRTFNPLGDKSKILQKLEEVAVELEKDMQKTGWTGRTVTLKYKLDTYQGGWLPNFVQRMLLICWIQFLLAPNHLIVG